MIPDAHRNAILDYLVQTARDKGDPAPDEDRVIAVIRTFFHDNPKATTTWLSRCLHEKNINVPSESVKAFLESLASAQAPAGQAPQTHADRLPPQKKIVRISASKANPEFLAGAALLTSFRTAKGMSPEQLDSAAEFPIGFTLRVETAQRGLKGPQIDRIYHALGITLEEGIALQNAYPTNKPTKKTERTR